MFPVPPILVAKNQKVLAEKLDLTEASPPVKNRTVMILALQRDEDKNKRRALRQNRKGQRARLFIKVLCV